MDEGRDYAWLRITTDQAISHKPCDLLFVDVEPSGNNSVVTVYNGENTDGTVIDIIRAATKSNSYLSPPKPIYCNKGLYIDIGDNVTAVLVQWREVGYKKPGGQ